MTNQSHTPQSVVHFEKIGQIAMTVEDLARAKDFYQNTLGMRFLFDAGHLVFFQCGDIRLMVSEGKRAENARPHGDTVIYFKVEDLQAVYADLAGRGVTFLEAPHLIATMPDHFPRAISKLARSATSVTMLTPRDSASSWARCKPTADWSTARTSWPSDARYTALRPWPSARQRTGPDGIRSATDRRKSFGSVPYANSGAE